MDKHLENPLSVLIEEISHELCKTVELEKEYQITERCKIFWCIWQGVEGNTSGNTVLNASRNQRQLKDYGK